MDFAYGISIKGFQIMQISTNVVSTYAVFTDTVSTILVSTNVISIMWFTPMLQGAKVVKSLNKIHKKGEF